MTVGNHTLPTELLRDCTEGFLYCISDWANAVTNNAFFVFILLAFCVVIFMSTVSLGGNRAFGFSSFVGMIGAIWLAVMNLMAWAIASVFIIVGVIGLVIMMMTER